MYRCVNCVCRCPQLLAARFIVLQCQAVQQMIYIEQKGVCVHHGHGILNCSEDLQMQILVVAICALCCPAPKINAAHDKQWSMTLHYVYDDVYTCPARLQEQLNFMQQFDPS